MADTKDEPRREGSLDAPTRHHIPWQNPAYYDEEALDKELRRVFDICHGCRRCFNLCDSFPRLFDLIDGARTGELDSVDSTAFQPVIDACTLCDMCFMTKCPYVPPHEFDLDFPHLMLRYRAVEARKGKVPFAERQLTRTDRNGRLARLAPRVANWASDTGNKLTRPLLERVAHVHRAAALPKYHGRSFDRRARDEVPQLNTAAPAHGRKAVLYATCFVNYNNPDTGVLARRVLALNGVETEVSYVGCCGMPQLEHGEIDRVATSAREVAAALRSRVDEGFKVVPLVPSCTLMLKFEWPLIIPDDPNVAALSQATMDISEYIVDIARNEGLAGKLEPLDGNVTAHIACHARAQNVGRKAADMLRLIPDTGVQVIERCSGHGGSWGIMRDNFEVALKVGKPVARQALKNASPYVASECPLAADHILQGMERLAEGSGAVPRRTYSPIELLALSYGLTADATQ